MLWNALGAAWIAGLAAFGGGAVALFERSAESTTKSMVVHAIVAFGGGVLLSAVAFALAPEGVEHLSTPMLAGVFVAGAIVFCAIDAWLTRTEGNVAQLLAMLMDFIPESIALGAVFGRDARMGLLLALFIGTQNFPEGFNSARELASSGMKRRTTLLAFLGISLLGPLCAWLGMWQLQDRPAVTAGIMNFAAGGIVYLVFQDIAPKARMARHWVPPLGAAVGFALGMAGEKLLGG